jgi:hypothetical protein
MKRSSRNILCYLFLITGYFSLAQTTNNWYFGSPTVPNAGLRLSFPAGGGAPTVSRGFPIATEEGSSSISDASGNPLFYTDGVNVWDASTNTTFGTGLLGGSSSTQSAIVMPKPGATNEWLIFTSGQTGNNGVNYYTVSGTPGSFTISAATNLVPANIVGEGLFIIGSTRVGSSFWVIARDQGSTGVVRAWDVTNTGVVNATEVTSTLSNAGFTQTSYTSKIGTIKSNTCQTKLAFTYLNGDVDLTDFNTATGTVTANTARRINVASTGGNNGSYGIEFSPNDDYLYISNLAGNNVYQHDIANNTTSSIGTTTHEAGQLQAGPDGKIYMAINGEMISGNGYLGVINAPNSASPNFVANGLLVTTAANPNGYSFRGLPTFPKSLVVSQPILSPGAGTYCVNTAIPLSFSFAGALNPATVVWSTTGGGGTFSPSNTALSPSVTYTTTGSKTISVDFSDECGRTYSRNFTVNIINVATTTGSITCGGSCLTLTSPSSTAVWYDAAVGGNIIGTGTSATVCYASDAYTPGTLYVAESASASSTIVNNRTIGMPAASLSFAAEASPYGPVGFDVLADMLTLNSFNVMSWNTTGNFDVEIRNSANNVVFLKTYTITVANTPFTVNVNADFLNGSYNIRLINTTLQWYRNSWAGQTVANEMALPAGSLGATGRYSLANFNYNYKDFSVTTTCTNRTAVSKVCSLPVELISFTGKAVNSSIELNWITSSEIGNDYFDVQRSYDGIIFTSIGKVSGAGYSNTLLSYSFVDESLSMDHAYYRLVQHDVDGTQNSTDAILVQLSGADISIQPNPSDKEFTLTFTQAETAELVVMEITGKTIFTAIVNENQFRFGDAIPSGTYLAQITTSNGIYVKRIVKK